MMEVVFSERARRDIAEIYEVIAAKNPVAALRVERLIRANCDRLGQFPMSAFKTDEPNLYRLPLVRYPYAIYYRVDPSLDRVEVARIIHGALIKNLRRMPIDDAQTE